MESVRASKLAMASYLVVDFVLTTEGGDMVHRIRNWGEDVWSALRHEDWAYVSLNEVDRAKERVRITVFHKRYLKRARALAEKTLNAHNLFGNAQLTELAPPG